MRIVNYLGKKRKDSPENDALKVSKFQNEFIKSSFLPTKGRNPDNFSFIFWEKR